MVSVCVWLLSIFLSCPYLSENQAWPVTHLSMCNSRIQCISNSFLNVFKCSSRWCEAWEHKSLFISCRLWSLSPCRSNFGMTKSAISLSSPYWGQRTCLQGKTADHAILTWRSTSSLTEGEIRAVMPIRQKNKKNIVFPSNSSIWLCSEWHTLVTLF